MASTQPNNFYFPHFPPPPSHPFSPPPPSSHSFKSPPPPPHSFAPPPPHGHPPPPFHPFAPPPPHVRPPPSPHHPITPPPPHVRPPPPHVRPLPPPLPPSPSPNHPIVIVIVIVSLGGLGLLSLLAFALFCCIQQRKKKTTQETDIIHVDEHKKVEETTVPGPFGQQAVVISVEDDVHIDEEIRKTEKLGHGLHAKSSAAEADQGNSSSLEVGTTSPGHEHHLSSSIQNRREKTPETDIIHIDEHTKVKETIAPNPFGQQAVAISLEDDVHIDEKIRKAEKIGHDLHAKSSSNEADQGNSCSLEVEVGTTSPGHEHHHHHH